MSKKKLSYYPAGDHGAEGSYEFFSIQFIRVFQKVLLGVHKLDYADTTCPDDISNIYRVQGGADLTFLLACFDNTLDKILE